jgi:hypothetical protein
MFDFCSLKRCSAAVSLLALTGALHAAPVMTGDTLTVLRAFPSPTEPYLAWNPVSVSTTVTTNASDLISWLVPGFNVLIDPGANNINFSFLNITNWSFRTLPAFDGFVVSGFSHEISSVTLLDNSIGASVRLRLNDNARQVLIDFDGGSTRGSFNIGLTFADPTAVSSPGTLALAGLALAAMTYSRRRAGASA